MRTRISIVGLILALGIVFSACKKDPVTPKTDEELQLEKLEKTWIVESGSNKVTIAENDVTDEWTSFELTFTEGNYTSSGAASTDVWPAGGTWSFATDDVTIIQRDGIDISINVSDNTLLMTFTYTTGGRLDGVDGNWVFNMVPK